MAKTVPVKASTQQHLSIEDIRDDLVILKSGGAALILETTAVNFGLLSEEEQDATIYTYAALLNSLTFPVEIVIRSKKTDISSYVKLIDDAYAKQPNPDLKQQILYYKQFISATVQQNEVLEKQFYLVVPFSPLEAGFKGVAPQKGKLPAAGVLEIAKPALVTRRDHVVKQLSRLGIKALQLSTQQLIELFFDIYNPASVNLQKVGLEAGSYTTTIVEPSIEPAAVAPQKATLPPQTQTPLPPSPTAPAQSQPAASPPTGPVQKAQPIQPAPSANLPVAAGAPPTSQVNIPPAQPVRVIPQTATLNPNTSPGPTPAHTDLEKQINEALAKLKEATTKAQQTVAGQNPGGKV